METVWRLAFWPGTSAVKTDLAREKSGDCLTENYFKHGATFV